MIKVTINGKDAEIAKDTTARQLLDERKIKKGAVWIGDKQLLKKEYDNTTFNEGDAIKVLRLMSGG